MNTLPAIKSGSAEISVPEVTPHQEPVDWQRAFVVLTAMTCTGFVTSQKVEEWVQTLRDEVDPRAAEVLIAVFSKTRSKWMQDFMG